MNSKLSFQEHELKGKGVLEAAVRIVQSVHELPEPHTGQILLTFRGETDAFDIYPDVQLDWRRALRAALDRGWDVIHLQRLTKEPLVNPCHAREILARLAGKGSYLSYYFHEASGGLKPPHDFLIVPGYGAIIAFATLQSEYVDAALFIDNPEQVRVLTDHFSELRKHTKSLLTFHAAGDISGYEAIIVAEQKPGHQFLVQPGLPFSTRPSSWLRPDSKWALGHQRLGVDVTKLIDLYKQRSSDTEEHIKQHRSLFICSKRAVEDLRKNGWYGRSGVFDEDKKDRIEHLENTVRILETYANYELALVDKTQEDLLSPIFWEVITGTEIGTERTLLMEVAVTDPYGNPSEAIIEVTEPTLMQSFHTYFLDLWSRVNAQSKDKREVISWLRSQIDLVPQEGN